MDNMNGLFCIQRFSGNNIHNPYQETNYFVALTAKYDSHLVFYMIKAKVQGKLLQTYRDTLEVRNNRISQF